MFRLSRSTFRPCFPLLLIIVLASASCSESQELTRSRARALIKESKEFKETATIEIKSGNTIMVEAKAKDEPEVEAQPRAVEAYLDDRPVMAVLRYLDLIQVTAEVSEKPRVVKAPAITVERPNGTTAQTPLGKDELKPWVFTIRVSLTDKGRAVSNGSEKSLPAYTREVLEVTGITNVTGQAKQAQAEFKWRIVPTAIGEVFDRKSRKYQDLPPKLRELLKKSQGVLQRTPLASTSEIDSSPKNGVAFFQRYDDGWRLTAIQ